MVECLVYVHQVEIVLDSGDVRISEFREIGELALGPVKIKLVIHHRIFLGGTRGQRQKRGQQNEYFPVHI